MPPRPAALKTPLTPTLRRRPHTYETRMRIPTISIPDTPRPSLVREILERAIYKLNMACSIPTKMKSMCTGSARAKEV